MWIERTEAQRALTPFDGALGFTRISQGDASLKEAEEGLMASAASKASRVATRSCASIEMTNPPSVKAMASPRPNAIAWCA